MIFSLLLSHNNVSLEGIPNEPGQDDNNVSLLIYSKTNLINNFVDKWIN
jgi:hypothetical protein